MNSPGKEKPVTPERLDEWEALEKAATPGPWELREHCVVNGLYVVGEGEVVVADANLYNPSEEENFPEFEARLDIAPRDFAFIAAARNGMVRDLCAEVRASWAAEDAHVLKLREELAEAKAAARNAKQGEECAVMNWREDAAAKRLLKKANAKLNEEMAKLREQLAAKDSQVALFKDAADVARRNAGIPMRTVLAALARVFSLGFEADGAGPLEPAFRAALEAEGWKDGKRGPRK